MENTPVKDSDHNDKNELIKEIAELQSELFHYKQMVQSILDTIPQRVFWKDKDLNFLGCNRPFAEDAGLNNPDEIKGKNDYDFKWKDFAELYRNDDREVIETAKPKYNYEEPLTRQDETKSWLRTSKVPLFDINGNVVGILGTFEDITGNKHAQETLQHERQLLRTLIDNIPDAFYVKDIECRKTMANYIDIRNLGAKSESEVVGKDDFDFFSKEVAENFYKDDQSVLHGNPVLNREEYYIDPEGKKKWLLTSKIPIRDGNNNITGLVGIGRDITERKIAEEAYHEASEKFKRERNLFKTLIDNQPDFIFCKDTEGRYILNNLAHLKYLGVEKQGDTLNKTVFDFRPREIAEKHHAADLEIIQSGTAVLGKEENLLYPNGENGWQLISKIPLRDSEGKVNGLLGVSHDITSRKKAEEALNKSKEKLAEYSATLEEKVEMRTKMLSEKNEELDLAFTELKETQTQLVQAEKMASLGQLTAGIAHEIKNPLNFVNNFAKLSIDLVKEVKQEIGEHTSRLDPKVVDYIGEILTDLEQNVVKIDEHGKRADSIVKGMLLHSRGKAGEMIKTDINNLLKEYVGLAYHGFRALDSSFNINIDASYDQSIGMIKVVPQDISRVFLNIINNACYSTNEKKNQLGETFKPTISVCTKDLNNKIQIQIRDNGLGIPKDIMEKVFNPFFTTKPTGKGTGLGLSLSFDIVVQVHKGELKVDSEVGEFAEFTITLPKNL